MCDERGQTTMRAMSSTSTQDLSEELRSLWRTRPVRTPDDSKIAGVAGGFGRRYNIDPVVIRVAFVITALWGGAGVFLYALLWLLLRTAGDEVSKGEALLGRGRASGSKLGAIALVVVVLVSAPTFGGSGQGFLVGAGFLAAAAMLAGWYGLYRRTPQPPAGWEAVSAMRPGAPGQGAWRPGQQGPWRSGHVPGFGPAAGAGAGFGPAAGAGAGFGPAAGAGAGAGNGVHGDGTSAGADAQAPGSDAGAPYGPPTPPTWDPLGAAPFAWDLPEPGIHISDEQPAKKKSRLTKITLGLAIIAVAVATGLAQLLSLTWLDATSIAAIALAVVAGGLLIGAVTRRGHGLLIVAGPLAGFVLLSSFVQTNAADWQTFATEHQYEITSPAQLETPLTNEFGSLTIDMTGLELDRDRTYTISNEVGEVHVKVPEGMAVDANCTAEIGSVDCSELQADTDGPVLTLDISNDIGSVKVTR